MNSIRKFHGGLLQVSHVPEPWSSSSDWSAACRMGEFQDNLSVVQLVWCSVLQVYLQRCIGMDRGGLMSYFWHLKLLPDVLYSVMGPKYLYFCIMVGAARHLKGMFICPIHAWCLIMYWTSVSWFICSLLSLSNYSKESNVFACPPYAQSI